MEKPTKQKTITKKLKAMNSWPPDDTHVTYIRVPTVTTGCHFSCHYVLKTLHKNFSHSQLVLRLCNSHCYCSLSRSTILPWWLLGWTPLTKSQLLWLPQNLIFAEEALLTTGLAIYQGQRKHHRVHYLQDKPGLSFVALGWNGRFKWLGLLGVGVVGTCSLNSTSLPL